MEINLASMFDATATAPATAVATTGQAVPVVSTAGQLQQFASLFEQAVGSTAQLALSPLPETAGGAVLAGVRKENAEGPVAQGTEQGMLPAAALLTSLLLSSAERGPDALDGTEAGPADRADIAADDRGDDQSHDLAGIIPPMAVMIPVAMAAEQQASTGASEPTAVSIGAPVAAVPPEHLPSQLSAPAGQKPAVAGTMDLTPNKPVSTAWHPDAASAVVPQETNTAVASPSLPEQQHPSALAEAVSARGTLGSTPTGMTDGGQKPVKLAGKPVALPVAEADLPPARDGVKQNIPVSQDLAVDVAIAETTAQDEGFADSGSAFGDHDQQPATTPGHGLHPAARGANAGQPVTSAAAAPLTVNHEAVIEQVRDRLATQEVKSEGNQVRLQLRPAELGELQITLKMDNQQLKVEILAENKAVKAALLEHADTLKEVLARQNIAVERFDVSTGGGFGQWFREGTKPEEQAQQSLARFGSNRGFKAATENGAGSAVAWQPRRNALVDVRL